MMRRSIIDRVKSLGFPEGEYIIIGSGIMDALGLRESHDVDAVVSDKLFQELKTAGWKEQEQYGVHMLTHMDVEVWPSWYHDGLRLSLTQLIDRSVVIDGVRFVSPEFLLEWKQASRREKDLADIKILEEYLSEK